MNILRRFRAWRVRSQHFAHLRYLQRNRVLFAPYRGALPPPERQVRRPGPEAVCSVAAVALLLVSQHVRAQEPAPTWLITDGQVTSGSGALVFGPAGPGIEFALAGDGWSGEATLLYTYLGPALIVSPGTLSDPSIAGVVGGLPGYLTVDSLTVGGIAQIDEAPCSGLALSVPAFEVTGPGIYTEPFTLTGTLGGAMGSELPFSLVTNVSGSGTVVWDYADVPGGIAPVSAVFTFPTLTESSADVVAGSAASSPVAVSVDEPGSLGLMGVGLLALIGSGCVARFPARRYRHPAMNGFRAHPSKMCRCLRCVEEFPDR
jgi:hypothetical protein